MNIDEITVEIVFKALKIIRSAGRLSVSPLVELDLVRLRLRGEGVHDSPEGRAWMLGKLLDEIVWEHLGQLRTVEQPISREALTTEDELALLGADFRTGQPDREAWSLLHSRFLSLGQPSVGELADHLGVARRTLERRARRGYALLAASLRGAERDATQRIDTMPGAPAHERIHVEEATALERASGTETRVTDAIAGAVIASVRDDERVLRLGADDVRAFVRGSFKDLDEYRASRIAEWSLPRDRLDERFVDLAMLVDAGSESEGERWNRTELRFDHLSELLNEVDAPAIVLLGSPGSGKSTLLRRLELELAAGSLRGHDETRVTYFVQLNDVRGLDGESAWSPYEWLTARWRSRYPELPRLEELLAQGRMTLLLDALNEIPHSDPSALRVRIIELKNFLHEFVLGRPGNRVVFSCRSLDYSAPLSTPHLRVPQVRIEPMEDEQVKKFLQAYSPMYWRETWSRLEGSRQLDVLRSPYFLRLLTEQVEATGEMPNGRASLFTGFVRQTLRREVELENPLFAPDTLITIRDIRRITHWRWKSAHELPEKGILLPKLAALAYGMQSNLTACEQSQVRIKYDVALDLLGDERGDDILRAGVALGVLDEDEAAGELMYIHQLVQEYFAARELARAPNPEVAQVEWRAERISPTVEEVIGALDPADRLPPLPGTGWEETTILAAAMTEVPATFLRTVMETNLALAGRAASQPDLLPRLPEELLDELRWALVNRSRDPEADLRDRTTCGYSVGDLGDPRFERRTGPHGVYLLPPLIEIPSGTYPIGDDEPIANSQGIWTDQVPRHEVEIEAFEIGKFAVTNAEWRCFQEAGGYEDERWWDTEAGRAWRRGENTAAGIHAGVKSSVARCRDRPEMMDDLLAAGSWDEEMYERVQKRVAMSEAELDTHLSEHYPGGRHTEPASWNDARFNHSSQPVVSISWYEARAYLSWLSAQSGMAFRLPTEVEWETAARGALGRRYPYGDDFNSIHGNTAETHIKQATPIGVFPDGDTPEGVADLTGNVFEWTSSAFGEDLDATEFPYPYDLLDGREEPEASAGCRRVSRGGSWYFGQSYALAPYRVSDLPDNRYTSYGFRVVRRSACLSPDSEF